jgi:O-antigen ligase
MSDIFFRTKRESLYYRFGLISILFAGVLLSGSKASMLLLLASLAALFILKLSMAKKIHVLSSLSIFAIIFLSVAVIIKSIVGLEMSGGEVGYLGDTLKFDSYLHAGHERIVLSKDYIRLGMKSSLIGHGISAAYSLDLRTHSVTTALFIQVGLIGLLAYLFFLLAVIFRGLKVMTKLAMMRYRNYDIPLFVAAFVGVIFLALKAEVTGDVPANRELWMFAGVFMALSNIVRLTEVTMFASFHLLPSHNT